jgi:hypothetical protein
MAGQLVHHTRSVDMPGAQKAESWELDHSAALSFAECDVNMNMDLLMLP